MLHIILFILKIIGIILASIIGFLLFVILIVLLVPIKYRVNADKKEDLTAEAKITWLFRLLYLHISFIDNHYKMRFRILGKVFYDSDITKDKQNTNGDENKSVRKKKKKDKREKIKKDKREKIKKDKRSKTKEDNSKSKINKTDNNKVIDKDKNDDNKLINRNKKDIIKINKKDELGNESKQNSETTVDIVENNHLPKNNTFNESDEIEDSFNDFTKHKWIQKIINLYNKIKGVVIKIKNFFLNINKTIDKIKEFFLNINDKWRKIKEFFQDEINKLGLTKSLQSLLKILKHLHPKKLKIEIEIGTGDPCSTGQAVGVLAMLYGYYGENVQIIPNFETSILEGSIFCVGRIRIITLLIICIKLIINDHFKQLIKNMKVFKEEL